MTEPRRRSQTSAQECSSVGRAAVSKTAGRGFESYHSCHHLAHDKGASERSRSPFWLQHFGHCQRFVNAGSPEVSLTLSGIASARA